MRALTCILALLAVHGCDSGVSPVAGDRSLLADSGTTDLPDGDADASRLDSRSPDVSQLDAGKPGLDASRLDASKLDASKPKLDATKPDASKLDASKPDAPKADSKKPDASKPDLAKPDSSPPKPDLAKPDLAKPDLGLCGNKKLDPGETCDDGVTTACSTTHDGGDGKCVPAGTCSSGYSLDGASKCVKNTTGLSKPCQHGPGFSLFRFHYSSSSTSPSIDVWDATCSYSYAPSSACNVYAVYPGFGSVSTTPDGYPILTTSEYLRVRFSVAGLSFSKAAVHVQARSYATSSSTYYRVWSPLHGELTGGPVDNDWVYDWYGLDWTGYLTPSDQPSLTAIQIYAGQGSGSLAVKAVELCVQ